VTVQGVNKTHNDLPRGWAKSRIVGRVDGSVASMGLTDIPAQEEQLPVFLSELKATFPKVTRVVQFCDYV